MTRRTGVLAALSALLSGCSGAGVLNALVPSGTYQGREDVGYGPDSRQRLDIYQPLSPPAGAPPPIVVFFYGGSWTHGERADYRFVGEALASSGAIVLVADYRLSPQVRYPAFVQDSALALKWAFDHAKELGGDDSSIYVMGHSAGAYNAAMVALDARWLLEVGLSPSRLAGFIGIAGPYDFLPIVNPEAQLAFNWPRTSPETQPVNHVTAAAPRTLLLAPVDDKVVNPQRSTAGLGGRLAAAGVSTTTRLLAGVSHVTIIASMAKPLRRLAPVLAEVVAFLRLSPPAS